MTKQHESDSSRNEQRDVESASAVPAGAAEQENDERQSLKRRDYLQLSASAAAIATGTVTIDSVRAASAHRDISFDRVVDAVTDLGLDPTGSTPIGDPLEDALNSGALVAFPAGDYRVTREISIGARSGILGMGDDRSAVTFVPDTGFKSIWLRFEDPPAFLIENVTLDRRADYETSIGMMGNVHQNLQIHEVEYAGWTPSGPQMLVANVRDAGGQLLIDGFYRLGPTRFEAYPDSSLDIYLGTVSEATHTLRNVEIHNGSESAIYAGKAPGPVVVEDSYFKNCVHTAVRVAGENSAVRRTTVVMDTGEWDSRNEVVESTYDGEAQIELHRGIWTQCNEYEKAGPLVEDCEVIVRNCPGGIAGIFNNGDCGGIRIQNTRVQCDADDVRPIYIAEEWNHDVMNPPYFAQLDGVSVTGTVRNRPAIRVVERDGTTIQNCCIDVPNTDGIVFTGTQNGLVKDCDISAGGDATVFNDAQIDIENVSPADACPLPSAGTRPSQETTSDSDSMTDTSTSTTDTSTSTTTETETTTSTDTSTTELLEIVSVDGGPLFYYEMTVEGAVEKLQDGSRSAAEYSDSIVDNGDGTVTVSGKCGNGYGDGFYLTDAQVTEFSTDSSSDVYYLQLDGTEVTVEELLGADSTSGNSTSSSTDSSTTSENFIFTTRTELTAVADAVKSGVEPWASAWTEVKASADTALGGSLQSVTDDDGSHYFDLDSNDRHDYREAIATGDRVRNLAVASFVSGDAAYAEQAIDQIHHWFLDPDSYQHPSGSGDFGVEQYITIPKFLMAASILRGHAYWETKAADTPWNGGTASSPEAALAEWAVTWAQSLTDPNYNNIWFWRATAEAAAAAYAEDDALFDTALARYKADEAWADYNSDGSFQNELWRDNGFRYQLFRMKAHAMFCEIARHRGMDLYSYNNLKQAFDWMVSYVLDPSSWEWGTGSLDWDLAYEAPGVYEVAYSVWQEPAYLDAVTQDGRPVDDGRLLQWVTLTHGNLFDLDTSGTSLPHTITVDGMGVASTYEFQVSESAELITGDSTDSASGTLIEGTVTDEQDVYAFSGSVTSMSVEGSVNISFDASSN